MLRIEGVKQKAFGTDLSKTKDINLVLEKGDLLVLQVRTESGKIHTGFHGMWNAE